MTGSAAPQARPLHVDHSVRSIARLHADHHQRATWSERAVCRITAGLAQPVSLGVLAGVIAGWVGCNLLAGRFGYRPFDPPPFAWLSGILSLVSLFLVVLVLAAQRRDDQLAEHREQLTLGLAILNEQRMAKVIQLLEDIRGVDPLLRDRVDDEAQEMAKPTDPHSVLSAIREEAPVPMSQPPPARR